MLKFYDKEWELYKTGQFTNKYFHVKMAFAFTGNCGGLEN